MTLMRRRRLQLITTNCPKCGRPTVGTNRPIYGPADLHMRFFGQCSDCTTEQERHEMLHRIGEAIIEATL